MGFLTAPAWGQNVPVDTAYTGIGLSFKALEKTATVLEFTPSEILRIYLIGSNDVEVEE